MKKNIHKIPFLFIFLVSPSVYSQCTTTITYASSGSGITNIGTYCSPANLGPFQGGGVPTRYSPTISYEAHIAKTCAAEKGRIEMENGECMSIASKENLQQTASCAAMKDSGWSWGGGIAFQIVSAGVTYTIQDPNYQKCMDMVSAISEYTKDLCKSKKTKNENIARNANNAQCASFYQ